MKQFEKLTVRVLKNKYGNIILTQNEYHDELHRFPKIGKVNNGNVKNKNSAAQTI